MFFYLKLHDSRTNSGYHRMLGMMWQGWLLIRSFLIFYICLWSMPISKNIKSLIGVTVFIAQGYLLLITCLTDCTCNFAFPCSSGFERRLGIAQLLFTQSASEAVINDAIGVWVTHLKERERERENLIKWNAFTFLYESSCCCAVVVVLLLLCCCCCAVVVVV